MASPITALLDMTVHRNEYDDIPDHHITAATPQTWTSYLTNWNSAQPRPKIKRVGSRNSTRSRDSSSDSSRDSRRRIGFQNPWPSWYKPTRQQVWDALEWGEDPDPCIELAASHVRGTDGSLKSSKTGASWDSKSGNGDRSRSQLAAETLRVQTPDFTFDPISQQAKTTWLGHAGILVQLPPLKQGGRPFRCIFDPIFSTRSSPSQMVGPIRSYPPPCTVESLPPIDVYMLSHNHHDHLDYDTVVALWKSNQDWIRFFVPLGNKTWFVECGIDEDRVIELDWWESVDLSQSESEPVKITCTPNQHNSGRVGSDANETLWSSWYVELSSPKSYRVYFAGDTGYQFHPASGWPPEPPIVNGEVDLSKQEYKEKDPYPKCPAFEEIAERLGSPDLLLLPVAVGATFSFLRSYIPLPDSVSPFPRHKPGLTAHNHMPPWDAVHVLKLMTAKREKQNGNPPIAIAMHWGTFVPERTEVLKTLGQLEYACKQQDVQFGRSLNDTEQNSEQSIFLALNHGQSVTT